MKWGASFPCNNCLSFASFLVKFLQNGVTWQLEKSCSIKKSTDFVQMQIELKEKEDCRATGNEESPQKAKQDLGELIPNRLVMTSSS